MILAPPNYPGRILTDGSNDFAYDTMSERVPRTLREMQERNPDLPPPVQDALTQLREEIASNAPIAMIDPLEPDYADWLPAYDERMGLTWHNVDWFFAETFYYRQLIACTRWYENRRDPFTPYKREEYASDTHWDLLARALENAHAGGATLEERLLHALSFALWGNRIDLSYAPSLQFGTATSDDDLLVDDRAEAAQQLLTGQGALHIITDNAGSELTMDLALADLLLAQNVAPVVLHVKAHPTFISDAITDDVWNFVDLLDGRGGDFARMGGRLRQALEDGRLRLSWHIFWNSSLSMWEMPPHLLTAFRAARLVIVKGDANYRRLMGDGLWPAETPFADVMGYFPAPLLALRVMKSDPLAGLPAGMAEQLDQTDADWRINGRRGVMQFKR